MPWLSSDFLLPLLTVLGLLCTTIAAILGVFHDYKHGHTGALTYGGKVLLLVSILGGVIGVSAAITDAWNKQKEEQDTNEKTRKILSQLDRSLHPLTELRTYYTLRVDAPGLLSSLYQKICPPAGQNSVLVQDRAILEHFGEVIANTRVNLSFHLRHPGRSFSQVPCQATTPAPAGCLDLNFSGADGSQLHNNLYLNSCSGVILVGGEETGHLWGNAGVTSILDLRNVEMAVFGSTFFANAAHAATIENVGIAFGDYAPIGGSPPSFWTTATLLEHPDWPAYTHEITSNDLKQCCSIDVVSDEQLKATARPAKATP